MNSHKRIFVSHVQQKHNLNESIISKLAINLAKFHKQCEVITQDIETGSSAHAHQQTLDNFSQTLPLLSSTEDIATLKRVEEVTNTVLTKLSTLLINANKKVLSENVTVTYI
jgi:aminoglycoside phosphotransferase family enzyme